MAFNPNYTPTKLITVPNPAVGALPATWSMFNASQTPRDAAGYPVGGGHIWEPLTAVVAPIAYYNSDDISYPTDRRYIRASASLRQSGYTTPGTGRGGIYLTIVVGTRAAGDGLGIIYGVALSNRTGSAPASDLGSLRILQGPTSNTEFPQAFAANQWHRFGVELLGRTINGYVDPVGYGAISDVPGDPALTYFGTAQAPEDTTDDISVGFFIGGSFALDNYSGIGDIILEKLSPMASGVAGTSIPGTTYPTTFTGSPSPPSAPFVYADIPASDMAFDPMEIPPIPGMALNRQFGYHRYKHTRSAALMMNKLELRP